MRALLQKLCIFKPRVLGVQGELRTLAVNAKSAKRMKNAIFLDTFCLRARLTQNSKQATKKQKTAQMRAPMRPNCSTETITAEKRQVSPKLAQFEPKLAPS